MSENGTGMSTPPNNQPAGAVTSQEVGRKNPSQGKFKSGVGKPAVKIDTNKHGIRRETSLVPKRTGRPKKVQARPPKGGLVNYVQRMWKLYKRTQQYNR